MKRLSKVLGGLGGKYFSAYGSRTGVGTVIYDKLTRGRPISPPNLGVAPGTHRRRLILHALRPCRL